MLSVWRPSGQELATLNAEDFKDLGSVKKHLSEQCGFPVYLQKLMHGGRLLTDDAELEGAMDLQLVLLTISSLPRRFNAVAARDLASAAAKNHIHAVRCLLEAGAETDYGDWSGRRALMFASESGHVEMVRLLLQAGALTN